MISFHIIKNGFKLKNRQEIRKWLKDVISAELRKPGQIDIIFCSDDYLLELNKQQLNHNYYTDVLTFNYSEESTIISGDIFISTDRVKENAHYFNVEEDEELLRVVVHGILHLVGYNDETDTEILLMRKKELEYLNRINWL